MSGERGKKTPNPNNNHCITHMLYFQSGISESKIFSCCMHLTLGHPCVEGFLGWRGGKFKFLCILPFSHALTASAALGLTSGGKAASSCCPPFSCPGLSLVPSHSTCQSQKIGLKVRRVIYLCFNLFFSYCSLSCPSSVTPEM